ncbi:MAG: AMP-binding protein, partial [Candidatus Cryptobacteroides sp.]
MHNYLNLLNSTIKENWEQKALCFFQGEEITFEGLARHIAHFHLYFDQVGIKKGDKIAICAKNTNRWAVSFLSVNTYGAVIVPILADFTPDSVNSLVDHSDSLILFTDREIWDKLQPELMPQIKAAFNTDDFSLLFSRDAELQSLYENLDKAFEEKYPQGFGKADVAFRVNNED